MFGTERPPHSVVILDVKTLVWIKGADPKLGQDRHRLACTVVGDYYIVVGGIGLNS